MTQYMIRVAGVLSDELLSAFPWLAATTQPACTVLHGDLPDRAALASVLDYLDELGVEIVDLNRIPLLPDEDAS
jgi:hypothetical protein